MDSDYVSKRVIQLAAHFYGVDYHTVEVYHQLTNYDFGKLTLMDAYSQTKKSEKLRRDLKIIERRYKIEKIIKKNDVNKNN